MRHYLTALVAALALLSPAALAAPANDDFANRLTFTGASVADTTATATKETGEPNHALGQGYTASGKSVWYSWTPAASGYADFALTGAFNKVIAIYTGTALSNLTLKKNSCEISGYGAYGRFDAIAGTAYLIAVDGYSGASGAFTLSLTFTPPPPNDAFADRIALSGANASMNGANIGASKEPGEPHHAGSPGGHSVWWTWTAPASGRVTISVGGSFGKVIAIYTGTELASLAPVASSSAAAVFEAVAGVAYQIAVDGAGSYDFTASLSVTVALQPPPANDPFANAAQLSGSNTTVNSATNVSASMESGEPNHAGRTGGHSVWWTWTAPATGRFVVIAEGYFNKLLGVYTGASVAALTEVASGYGTSGTRAQAGFDATQGTVYRFAVDGESGASGSFDLHLKLPPLNDDFANRFILTGSSATATANSATATKEAGEPDHAGRTGGTSLWWTWTAPAAGRVMITVTTTTTITGFDPAVAVYTGTELAALTASAGGAANRPGPAYANFDAVADMTYQLAVDGDYGTGGALTLQITYVTAPPNDHFADRTAVVFPYPASPNVFYVTGSNLGATKEAGETWQGSASVWWTWTAPASGEILIELETYGATMVFPWLDLYSGTALATLTRISPRVQYSGNQRYHVARFPVTSGTAYAIWVDSRSGSQGTYTLRGTFEPPPANDHFANRATLTSTQPLFDHGYQKLHSYNVGATRQTGEPWHGSASYQSGWNSVWWTWIAPYSGRITLAVRPIRYSFESKVAVYTGTAVNGLTRLASAYSTCTDGSSSATTAVTAGTTYQFAVDGGPGEFDFVLNGSFDNNAPTVVITNPVPGQAPEAAITVSGTATDPLGTGGFRYASGVALVEVRLNGGTWEPATGTSAWSRALTLTDGFNLIEARARDLVGKESALASVVVVHGALSPFETWISALGIANPADWLPAANPDHDSLNNLGEFATDGNPASGAGSGKIVGKIAPVGGVNAFTLTLPVRNGAILDPADPAGGELGLQQTVDGLFYKIQASDGLGAWTLAVDEVTGEDATAIQIGLPALNAGWTYRTFRSPGPVAGGSMKFMRVEISDH